MKAALIVKEVSLVTPAVTPEGMQRVPKSGWGRCDTVHHAIEAMWAVMSGRHLLKGQGSQALQDEELQHLPLQKFRSQWLLLFDTAAWDCGLRKFITED